MRKAKTISVKRAGEGSLEYIKKNQIKGIFYCSCEDGYSIIVNGKENAKVFSTLDEMREFLEHGMKPNK
jgi:hypothetical protein